MGEGSAARCWKCSSKICLRRRAMPPVGFSDEVASGFISAVGSFPEAASVLGDPRVIQEVGARVTRY